MESTLSIALVLSIIGCVVTVSNFYLARKEKAVSEVKTQDNTDFERLTQQTEQNIKVNVKLDQLCSTVNEIRTDVKATNKEMSNIHEEVIVLKRDMKTLWSEVDSIKEKVYHND